MLSRLFFNPYTLGALALLIVGMGGTIFYYRSEAIEAGADAARYRSERDTVIATNQAKDKEIERLTRQAEINNQIMVDVHKELQELNAKANETSQALSELENTNVDVKTFLDTALPDAYKRVLNGK